MNELSQFSLLEGGTRELIDIEELSEARRAGWLAEDNERRRPRYFDGRFLAARDLSLDQRYFGIRQQDLGRVAGTGVVAGLDLHPGATSSELIIDPGHGLTPSGDAVVLLEQVAVDVADVAAIQDFDVLFGLEVRPNAPARNRTGLFVLALRNVEYTANPVATFPKDLQSQRRIEDGDVIEATAVTLIPFEGVAPSDINQAGRARLAREIFLRNLAPRLPSEALPIGAVALERGAITWIDPYLVRRDSSVDDALGFGSAHRAVRQAFLRQYRDYLAELPAIRVAAGQTGPFAASDHFQVLPPFGPLPVDSLQVVDEQIVQGFFPPEVNVELTIVPDDEVSGLQDEALALPAIDLRAPAAVLEETSVLLLVPISRVDFALFVPRLEGRLSRFPVPRMARQVARRSVTDTLSSLRVVEIQRRRQQPVLVNLQPWQDALSRATTLFYVRRRRQSQVSFSFPRFQAFPGDSPNPTETLSNDVRERLIRADELIRDDANPATPSTTSPIDFLLRRTTNEVLVSVEGLLSKPLFAVESAAPFINSLFVNGVVAELGFRTIVRLDDLVSSSAARRSVIDVGDGVIAPEASAPVRVRALTVEDVQQVAARYSRARLREGFALLVARRPELLTPQNRTTLAQSFRIPELDNHALRLSQLSTAQLNELADDVARLAAARDVGGLRDLVDLHFTPADETAFPEISGFPGSRVAADLGEGALYLIVHRAAAGEPALQRRISDLFMRPAHDQRMIVSTLLAGLLVEALNLTFPAPQQLAAVNVALEALSGWNPSQVFRVPGNGIQTGGVLNSVTNADVANLLTAYETIQPHALLGLLSEILVDKGFPGTLDNYRTLGFSQRAADLAKKVLARASESDAATLTLVRDITAALSNIRVINTLVALANAT